MRIKTSYRHCWLSVTFTHPLSKWLAESIERLAPSQRRLKQLNVAIATSAIISTGTFAQPTTTTSVTPVASAAVLTPPDSKKIQTQRLAYQAAKKAISNKQYDAAKSKLSALNDYPLKPYIEYQLINAELSSLPFTKIDDFVEAYPNSLLADKLLGSTLFFLAEQQKWPEFNRYYSAGFSSAAMQCRHLLARFHTGDSASLDDAVDLWTVGHSQPDACNPLFSLLEKHQTITDEDRWQRFDAAIKQRQVSLARYIQRGMDKKHQSLANLYLQTVSNPGQVTQHAKYAGKAAELQTIIAYGIAKLAQRDPLLAWKHWEIYEAQRLFSADIATPAKKEIVKYLTRKGHLTEADQLLSYSHSLRETTLIEELARENLEQLNWQAVLTNIALLPAEEQSTERWRYWFARSHQELGNTAIDAQSIYQSLAQKRSWYGFLAADHLEAQYTLEDSSAPADPTTKIQVSQDWTMRRAHELWLIGEPHLARSEWYYGLKNFNTEEILAAGELARDWGWYNSGIVAMITGNLWDHLSLRFPLAYDDAIAQASVNTQLDKALIFAIARQESAFAEDALSHAGARGLMQLMPATAKQQAKVSGLKNHTTGDLFKPEHNIQLGSEYLGQLLTQFNGNRILATAAYNAGPHRVKQWLGRPIIEKPADVWVETIPFRETRQYVQNVLTYSVIYNYRMEGEHQMGGNLLRSNELNIRQ